MTTDAWRYLHSITRNIIVGVIVVTFLWVFINLSGVCG